MVAVSVIMLGAGVANQYDFFLYSMVVVANTLTRVDAVNVVDAFAYSEAFGDAETHCFDRVEYVGIVMNIDWNIGRVYFVAR